MNNDAATVYAGYEALKAEDIADAISYCVNAPEEFLLQNYAFIQKHKQNRNDSP